VTKAFGRTVALAAMSLALHAGEVHGLIGETGASTSSLLRIRQASIALSPAR
jgi:ribose transport system ATP-binding protein